MNMRRGPKPLGRLLIPKILQVLEEANCDLRVWTITVRLRIDWQVGLEVGNCVQVLRAIG